MPMSTLHNKKGKTYQPMGFAVPADHRAKIKERGKIDKYLELELEKSWRPEQNCCHFNFSGRKTPVKTSVENSLWAN